MKKQKQPEFVLTPKGAIAMWLMARTGVPLGRMMEITEDPTFTALAIQFLQFDGVIKGIDDEKANKSTDK